MKFIQKTKIIIILLIFVTLLFALLGSLNLYSVREGLTLECPAVEVPICSNETTDTDMSDELQYYALKTELVPPICPNCPYYADISYGAYHNSPDDDLNKNTTDENTKSSIVNGNNNNSSTNSTDVNIGNKSTVDQSTTVNSTSEYSNNQEDNSTANQDNSVSQNTNTKQNVNQDNSQTNTVKQDNSQRASADNKWNNLFGNNSISFGGGKNNSNIQTGNGSGQGSGSGQGNSNVTPYSQNMTSSNSNPFMLQQGSYLQGPDSETANMINNLNQKVNLLMNEITTPHSNFQDSSNNCKRTQNYRSSDNIPVPILNDFSRF
jgi:hypothetical protein